MKSSDFKNFLEKNILTYTKGTVEKNFEKVILTSGWNIKPSTSKKKILEFRTWYIKSRETRLPSKHGRVK